ncbi:MAG: hypothetical protein JW722_01020 [Demequinaceae bacterium]|nr:hypothetical protein [Demequinaceae bacterium]
MSPGTQAHRFAVFFSALALGAATGILAKLADASGSYEAGIITSNVAVWVLGVSLWGARAVRMLDAVARSAAFSLTMNIGYYGWASWVLGDHWPEIASVWILIGLTAVPIIAAGVHLAVRSPAPWSGAVFALVGAIALTDEPVTRAWDWVFGHARYLPQAPLSAAISVATWAVVVFVLPRHRPTRLWGLAFALPAYLLVDQASQVSWPILLGF